MTYMNHIIWASHSMKFIWKSRGYMISYIPYCMGHVEMFGAYWLFNGFLDQLYFPSFFINLWIIELMIFFISCIKFISYELYILYFVEISLLFDINNRLLTIICWRSYVGDLMMKYAAGVRNSMLIFEHFFMRSCFISE